MSSFVLLAAAFCSPAFAACSLASQGEGRVVAVMDGRTFRLDDGREVRLAGVEVEIPTPAVSGVFKLASLIEGRPVALHADDDKPDRYGRQIAVVNLVGSDTSVQTELLSQGDALFSGIMSDKECSAEWIAAENAAREARRGVWAADSVTKNAEMPGDILARTGRYTVVEGTVVTARQAGSTYYVNFGRRWTRDFAVTISRRMVPSFEAAGLDFKSLAGRKIRVRGWVEKHGGPRIDATHPGQIEIVGAVDEMAKNIVHQDQGK